MKLPLHRSYFQTILLLCPLVILMAAGMDIYLPVIPALQGYFQTDAATVQLTLSLYMFTTGFGQLLVGPLADRLGRRPVAIGSTFLFLLASLLCAGSSFSIYLFIAARIFQGLGACGMMVIAFTVVRDTFSREEGARIYNYLNAGLALAPICAPILGGYLVFFFNWQSTFLLLALLSVVTLVNIWLHLPETRPEISAEAKRRVGSVRTYGHILRNREFQVYTLAAGTTIGNYFTFFSMSPILLVSKLDIGATHFGYLYSIVSFVYMIASFYNGRIGPRFDIFRTIIFGFPIILVGAVGMLGWSFMSNLSVAGFIVPMCVIVIGEGIVLGAAAAGALAPFKEMAGTAAALYGCLEFAIASLMATVAMLFKVETTRPLGITILIGALVTLLYATLSRPQMRKAEAQREAAT